MLIWCFEVKMSPGGQNWHFNQTTSNSHVAWTIPYNLLLWNIPTNLQARYDLFCVKSAVKPKWTNQRAWTIPCRPFCFMTSYWNSKFLFPIMLCICSTLFAFLWLFAFQLWRPSNPVLYLRQIAFLQLFFYRMPVFRLVLNFSHLLKLLQLFI